MRVVVVPVLSDNYAYLIIDDKTKEAACVDPAEAQLVLSRAVEEGVKLVSILTTHHHYDHAGGNSEMRAKIPDLKVYGGTLDNVMACTHPLDHGDEFTVGSIKVVALHTPGHTRGSISYYCVDGEEQAVFTGDTLFVGGCGRIFECTPADLHRSITEVLGRLPETTQVYVGHEYTVKNLEFATAVERQNESLQKFLQWAKEQKVQRKFTVPSTIQNEWLINPFMRSGNDEMKSICPGCSPVEVFARLRRQKDAF
uniref:hydroxyacylglutathione hydrolase n=2 Tax=Alexandrium monilatum TaxID=311494 RepID=A0A7S4UZY6_9DINO|mmetsp:Transcript_54258/g.168476  ORF Transcript_54258/g.168476 Transcript_54258/m.168476 type:complete len:254 (-) Transcript_54258:15-776(-)